MARYFLVCCKERPIFHGHPLDYYCRRAYICKSPFYPSSPKPVTPMQPTTRKCKKPQSVQLTKDLMHHNPQVLVNLLRACFSGPLSKHQCILSCRYTTAAYPAQQAVLIPCAHHGHFTLVLITPLTPKSLSVTTLSGFAMHW